MAQHSENEDHGIWSPHFMGNRWGNNGNGERLYLIIYRQYSRICNESIRLFQKNTQDRREDKIQPLTGGRGNNLTNILF